VEGADHIRHLRSWGAEYPPRWWRKAMGEVLPERFIHENTMLSFRAKREILSFKRISP
jgi:hypothetical protein